MKGVKSNIPPQVLAFIIIVSTISFAACFGSESNDSEKEDSIFINGKEYTVDNIFSTHTKLTITDTLGNTYQGVSLSLLINATGMEYPQDYQYSITASDGYHKNVTWEDMMKGVLVREKTMTAFSELPARYKIRDVRWINATHSLTITVNGHLYTYEEPFDILKDDLKTVVDSENNTYEGVGLSDLINLTSLLDPEEYNYSLITMDGYNKTVEWDDMENGVLVKEMRQAVFPEKDKKFWVKDIVEIQPKAR